MGTTHQKECSRSLGGRRQTLKIACGVILDFETPQPVQNVHMQVVAGRYKRVMHMDLRITTPFRSVAPPRAHELDCSLGQEERQRRLPRRSRHQERDAQEAARQQEEGKPLASDHPIENLAGLRCAANVRRLLRCKLASAAGEDGRVHREDFERLRHAHASSSVR